MFQPGKIKNITPATKVTEKLTKRELILDISGNYPQVVSFEAVNDKCALLDNLRIGDTITVHFNLNGREYNGKVYNTLSIFKIE